MTVRIGIAGASGRMGQALIRSAAERPDIRIAALLLRSGAGPGARAVEGAPDAEILDDPERLFAAADVVIDFTTAAASRRFAEIAADSGRPLVIGTTGFRAEDEAAIEAAAGRTALFRAANFSVGIALLDHLVAQAAGMLGTGYDAEILEVHHRHKRDAPSGTALALGDAIVRGRGGSGRSSFALPDRSGERRAGDIGFAVLRGGDVIGDHDVIFAGPGERISIGHRATDRLLFARGALRAACWLKGRPAGLYGMKDLLGLDAHRPLGRDPQPERGTT